MRTKFGLLGLVVAVAFVTSSCLNPGTYPTSATLQNGHAAVGLWRTLGGDNCYWARLRGFSGTTDDVIANDLSSGGPRYVEIKVADVGFETSGCLPFWQEPGPWATPLATPGQPFGPGEYKVAYEVAAGTYSAPGGETCYWARLSGFGGETSDVLANDLSSGGQRTVTIMPSDAGFTSDGCGTWTKIG